MVLKKKKNPEHTQTHTRTDKMKTYSRKKSSYLKKVFMGCNFNEMCRLCLSELDLDLTPIFQEFNKISYKEWIQYSVDVLIEEGDGLPPNICEECLAMVKQTYLFKKKCKSSDSKLRAHLELVELEEGKISDIALAEEHKDLFTRESSEGKCDESSAVDSGGTEPPERVGTVEGSLDPKPEPEAPEAPEEPEEPQEKVEEKVVINQVKRYILKGEKRADDQEEDLTVCEVVPLDVKNDECVSSETEETLTYTILECANQNGHVSELSNLQEMKIQEIYELWENEEEKETEEGTGRKQQEEGIMILDVSWEDSTDSNEKKQSVGLLEVDVEQNGVVQLHRVYTSQKTGDSEPEPKPKPKPNNFKCFVCGYIFLTGAELKGHISNDHHEVAEACYCETCGKSFVCLNNLKRHMSVHTGYKPHKCNVCGRTFSQGSILKRHIFTHETLKPFNCQICGKGYTQKMNLLSHFKNHGFRTENESFNCQHCSKSFMHQSGLSRHLKLHKGIRFTCKQCKKSFGDSSALSRHVKTIHLNKTQAHP